MALIKTVEELKKYLRLPSTNISEKLPAIVPAEERYLLPILGEELYTRLSDAYDANVLTPTLEQLLARCQAVVAPMAYLMDLPFLQASLSDNGITVMESQSTRKAFRWEYNEVKEALTGAGYSMMETLIIFLKEHRPDYPEWSSAAYNDAGETFLLRDGADLRKAVPIGQPHRCFLLLYPMLPMLCRLQVMPVISEAFFDHFNARIVAGGLSSLEQKLAGFLQIGLARLALAQAGVEMSVRFSDNGFTIVDQLKDQPEDGRKDPGEARLQRWCLEMERTGQAYLAEARKLLVTNADDEAFALFKSSDAFPKASTASAPDNSKYSGIFRMT